MSSADTIYDVLFFGAGLSCIGAAYHLQKRHPRKTYAILEAREDLGGTWDLFRFPGIRSDSDLFTFGYEFKPWESEKRLADGPEIKAYLAETARENGIDRHIRYRHRVLRVSWSSAERLWRVRVKRADTGEESEFRGRWIFSGTGYYRYDEGFTPRFEGRERFRGPIVHPQHWPADLDWTGKRVVVIGSGATAVTMIPALTEKAAHVTMVQRTPTYILPIPSRDGVVRRVRPWLGKRMAFQVARRFYLFLQSSIYRFCRRHPVWARKLIRRINARLLPEGYPVDVHFNPPYPPWEQRLCVAPDGDFFRVIREGKATVVTDRIKSFTETGIALESGAHLDADLIVTATGLNLLPFGGIELTVDGRRLKASETIAYKSSMLGGVPNLVFAIGYTSSSWTLKIGLLSEHFCRLLAYMDERGLEVCTPIADPAMPTRPLLELGSGYVRRSLDELPRQGVAFPWLSPGNYAADSKLFRRGKVNDERLRFTPRSARTA